MYTVLAKPIKFILKFVVFMYSREAIFHTLHIYYRYRNHIANRKIFSDVIPPALADKLS